MLRSVDFPQPDGPMIATNSPDRTVRSTPTQRPDRETVRLEALPQPLDPQDIRWLAHRSIHHPARVTTGVFGTSAPAVSSVPFPGPPGGLARPG